MQYDEDKKIRNSNRNVGVGRWTQQLENVIEDVELTMTWRVEWRGGHDF